MFRNIAFCIFNKKLVFLVLIYI